MPTGLRISPAEEGSRPKVAKPYRRRQGVSRFVRDRERAYSLGIMRWGEGGGGTELARQRLKGAEGHHSSENRGSLT